MENQIQLVLEFHNLILQNLIGIANMIEHFVLSSSSSLDGEAVASKDNISTRSTRSESDFVVIDKSSQKDNNCDKTYKIIEDITNNDVD